MKYLTLAVPSYLAPIANAICVAFEPDSGVTPENYRAFSTKCLGVAVAPTEENPEPVQHSSPGTEYVTYGAEVVDWLAESVTSWKTDPAALHAAMLNAYTERWPESEKPTLPECEQFCLAVLLSVQYGLIAGLFELGLNIDMAER
jgi:hypothetical protein